MPDRQSLLVVQFLLLPLLLLFFFFNDTATTEIYTLSLHDALPISSLPRDKVIVAYCWGPGCNGSTRAAAKLAAARVERSEEHTSELQSQSNLVCRLLLEKKKKKQIRTIANNAQHGCSHVDECSVLL